jgi:hypothetical protein
MYPSGDEFALVTAGARGVQILRVYRASIPMAR